MAMIQLSGGRFAVVDDVDVSALTGYAWHVIASGYAASSVWDAAAKKKRQIIMHRLLMGARPDQRVDHVDGDKLNNRRANLRFATNRQNARNRAARGPSGYNGVRLGGPGVWVASIAPDGLEIQLGSYRDPREAAAVYDAAARIVYGEFARLNGITIPGALERVIANKEASIKRLRREIDALSRRASE